ncbi:PPK2 family polyphosphate kinase [Brevibacterium litoralis]|uniref:PPK2 family polyphosphate kinase n=1 Tax=Brevibacterium litoralis TaxID=3138935 RepID=UPI0032EAC6CC
MEIRPAEYPPLAANVEQAPPAQVADALRFDKGDDFARIDTRATPGFHGGKTEGREAHVLDNEVLGDLQERLFANALTGTAEKSLLVVLQGRDSAGKGGVVKHVVGALSPHGVHVAAFGVPTAEESAHHFLWRVYRELPRYGHVGVFDRSHYEDILAARMHGLVSREVWEGRYDEINEFEEGLAANGTEIVKIMLTISKEEQAERLGDRLVRQDKHWKFSRSDIEDRERWDEYTEAFQDVLDRTSKRNAPWYVVPADRKWYSRWAVVRILIHHLEKLGLDWPEGDFDPMAEMERLLRTM